MLLVFGRPIDGDSHRPTHRQLRHHRLGVRPRLGFGLHAAVMQPAGQPPTGGFKVRKIARQGRLATRPYHQQGADKVVKRFALMAMCLGHEGGDIVFQASGSRVLCHGTRNSRTSPFSLPLAHLANVSRPQPYPPFFKRGNPNAEKNEIATARERRFRVVQRCGDFLYWSRFAGEHGFLDLQVHSVDQTRICRDMISGLNFHNGCQGVKGMK